MILSRDSGLGWDVIFRPACGVHPEPGKNARLVAIGEEGRIFQPLLPQDAGGEGAAFQDLILGFLEIVRLRIALLPQDLQKIQDLRCVALDQQRDLARVRWRCQ